MVSSSTTPFATLNQLYNQYCTQPTRSSNTASSQSSSQSSLDIKIPGSPCKHAHPPIPIKSPIKHTGTYNKSTEMNLFAHSGHCPQSLHLQLLHLTEYGHFFLQSSLWGDQIVQPHHPSHHWMLTYLALLTNIHVPPFHHNHQPSLQLRVEVCTMNIYPWIAQLI